MMGYPALVDAGTSVSLRLMDSPEAAAEANRAGLRRLFTIQLHEEMEFLEREMTDLERLCLYYSRVGRCDDLRDDILTAAADLAFFGEAGAIPRTREHFAARAENGWRRLHASGAR